MVGMSVKRKDQPSHVIELKLRDLAQLFNSMDPSPFYEKDLDQDAEEFIEGWAMELPSDSPLALAIHLENPPQEPQAECQAMVTEAVHHFFDSKAQMKRRQLRKLIALGRTSLVIGLVFLTVCVVAGELLVSFFGDQPVVTILQESFLIGGWVAMWRPMEIFLYEWWPIRNERRLLEKMSRMEVRIVEGRR
jgi:hypothetical protein